MCALRKGFDLPQCICNKAPRSNFKGLLFNLHHHRAYSKRHNISSSSPRLAYISIRLICLDLLYCADASLGKKKKKWKDAQFQADELEHKKTVVGRVPPSASIPTHDLSDCHPLNHPHLLISPSAKSWHMWLYVEDKDQITLAAFPLPSSKLYIAALHHSRQNERERRCTSHCKLWADCSVL